MHNYSVWWLANPRRLRLTVALMKKHFYSWKHMNVGYYLRETEMYRTDFPYSDQSIEKLLSSIFQCSELTMSQENRFLAKAYALLRLVLWANERVSLQNNWNSQPQKMKINKTPIQTRLNEKWKIVEVIGWKVVTFALYTIRVLSNTM